MQCQSYETQTYNIHSPYFLGSSNLKKIFTLKFISTDVELLFLKYTEDKWSIKSIYLQQQCTVPVTSAETQY